MTIPMIAIIIFLIIKMQAQQSALHDIPIAKISPQGIFKYILITGKITENGQEAALTFLRGDSKHEYHADNFEAFVEEVKAKGFTIKAKNIDSGKF